MSNGVDRLIAYRTMRAVQEQAHQAGVEAEKVRRRPSLWQRWQAGVYRWADRLLG